MALAGRGLADSNQPREALYDDGVGKAVDAWERPGRA